VSLKNSIRHLTSTFKHLKHFNQILLIPFTLWSGLEQTYISAQFTKVKKFYYIKILDFIFLFFKGFITCAVGIKYVGLIMIVFGVCDALSSFSFGHIAKYISRIYCLIFAALINYALIITMLIWVPSENQIWVLFILAGLWGIADGCWQTQSK
jgi:MFS family permease